MIDLFQSRATYNEPGKWWSRNESDVYESDELIMKRLPDGFFSAKEVAPQNFTNEVVAGSFMFDRTVMTIKSPDDLSKIRQNDIVVFRDEKWIVVNAQQSKAKNQNTFFAKSSNCSHFWYLELRK